MTTEDSDGTLPTTPDAEEDQSHDVAQQNDNVSGTRDELWQVQSDSKAAREVAARHLGRLMYTSREGWSHYVFHENDPQA